MSRIKLILSYIFGFITSLLISILVMLFIVKYTVLDETGSPLYSYVMFVTSEKSAFFITLTNKIYSVAIGDEIVEQRVVARLISESKVKSLKYKKGERDNLITLVYEDGNKDYDNTAKKLQQTLEKQLTQAYNDVRDERASGHSSEKIPIFLTSAQ